MEVDDDEELLAVGVRVGKSVDVSDGTRVFDGEGDPLRVSDALNVDVEEAVLVVDDETEFEMDALGE